jgi:hypothetical protein
MKEEEAKGVRKGRSKWKEILMISAYSIGYGRDVMYVYIYECL